jgi:hypothetical protein
MKKVLHSSYKESDEYVVIFLRHFNKNLLEKETGLGREEKTGNETKAHFPLPPHPGSKRKISPSLM